MKKLTLITSVFILALSFSMVSCHTMKKLEREAIETAVIGQVSPQQLVAVDGIVNFNYNIAFAPKQFYKKLVLKVTPRMSYPGGEELLPSIYYQGDKVKATNYPVVEYKGNTFSTHNLSFAFKEGMQKGVLMADIEATMGKKSVTLTPAILNSNGVKEWKTYAYSIPSNPNAIPLFTEIFTKDIPATEVGVVSGYVLFPLAQSMIPKTQKNSAIMNQAAKQVKEILSDKNAKITKMILFVSSSPEGSERLNKNLTNNRLKTSKAFFQQDLGLTNTPMVKNPKFIVSNLTDENWNGLYLLLNDSDIKNKENMIETLKKAPTHAKRATLLESYIQKVPQLKEKILPLLRRADFFVFYTKPTTLEVEEQVTAYYLPQLQENSVLSLQTDANLLNDLAVIAIQNKQFEKAKKLLEQAISLKQLPEFYNNLGIAYMNQGYNSQAKEMFNKASVKKEAKYNMGLILLQEGNYKAAIPYLKEMPNVNLAYAQLMAGENHAALNTFKQLNLTKGYEYYLMAVAAARCNEPQTLTTALEKAIQMDPQLKQWASTDKEFYPYAQNTTFIEIVE